VRPRHRTDNGAPGAPAIPAAPAPTATLTVQPSRYQPIAEEDDGDGKVADNDDCFTKQWYDALPRAVQIGVALEHSIEWALPAAFPHDIILEIVAGALPYCKANPALIDEAYNSLGVSRFVYVPPSTGGNVDHQLVIRECVSDSEVDCVDASTWGSSLNGEGLTVDDNWLVNGLQSDYTGITNMMAPCRSVCTRLVLQTATPLPRCARSAIVSYLGDGAVRHLKTSE
jgi:hypothetical protein